MKSDSSGGELEHLVFRINLFFQFFKFSFWTRLVGASTQHVEMFLVAGFNLATRQVEAPQLDVLADGKETLIFRVLHPI